MWFQNNKTEMGGNFRKFKISSLKQTYVEDRQQIH